MLTQECLLLLIHQQFSNLHTTPYLWQKRKKYEPLCNLAPPDKRLFFTPFVLESTGYLHEDAVNFLNLLAKRTAEIWKICETGIYQYFVKSLSCVLQKANASNINKRYHEIITGVHALDYTTAYRATYLENMIDSVIHRVI
jgi:hypothetical protein